MSVEKYFTFNFVNDLIGDPTIYVQNKKSGKAFLWDISPLSNLSEKQQLKVERVFISHTHMDHFMGVDELIRHHLPHKRSLHFYGPRKLSFRLENRLNSYVWNLIDPDAVCYFATEISDEFISKYKIFLDPQTRLFKREKISHKKREGQVWLETLENGDRIGAVCLNHINIDSISYYYEMKNSPKVNIDNVQSNTGSWLAKIIQYAVAPDETIEVDTPFGKMPIKEAVSKYVVKQKSIFFGYITDVGFTKENVKKIQSLQLELDRVFIESSFKDVEKERAEKRHHLTTSQSAALACLLNADEYEPFHFSQLYKRNPDSVKKEALNFFEKFKDNPELCRDFIKEQIY